MAKFKDKDGGEWALVIDVPAVEDVQENAGINIDELTANGLAGLTALLKSSVKFVQVLWVLCEAQANGRKVAPEAFARSFNGAALEDAANAFVEALADFSPRQQREALLALLAKGKELAPRMAERVMRAIAAWDPLKVPVKEPAPSDSATSAPHSSASTPAEEG